MTARYQIAPALAALIQGDKGSFYKCGFIGLQDTLWDGRGRHHYIRCYIEGVIDVISGAGQSIYEVNFKTAFNLEIFFIIV